MVSEEVTNKMSEIISRLSIDWSTVSFAALTTLPSSFTIRLAVSAVIVSCDKYNVSEVIFMTPLIN